MDDFSITTPHTHNNGGYEIQQDAAKNTINLGAIQGTPPLFTHDTVQSMNPVAESVENNPKGVFSRVIQWFKRKIWGEDPPKEIIDEPAMFDNAPTIPLEKPKQVSDDMMNNFVREMEILYLRSKKVDSEVDELLAQKDPSGDFISRLLVQRLIKRHHDNKEERRVSAEGILKKGDDIAALQTQQKELNANVKEIQAKQEFWGKVNFGCSTAMALLTLGGLFLVPTAAAAGPLGSAFNALQSLALLSEGGSGMVNAWVKKSTNQMTGEFISLKEDLRVSNENMDIDMKCFHEGHQALMKVLKNLKQVVEGQHQMISSLARY